MVRTLNTFGRRVAGVALRRLVAVGVLALVLAACGELPAPPVAEPVPVRSLSEPTATPEALPTADVSQETGTRGVDTVKIGGSAAELIERAKTEAASLARSSAESVQVVSVEEVDWSDSSLGCPQPGMMYAQVITPGYKIVVKAGETTYEFHSATNPQGPLVRCGG